MKKIIYSFAVLLIFISCQHMQDLEKQRQQERKEKREKQEKEIKESFVYKNFHGIHTMIPIAQNKEGKDIYFYFSEDDECIEFYWRLKDEGDFVLSKIKKDEFCVNIDSIYSEPRVSFEIEKTIFEDDYRYLIPDPYSENPNDFFIGSYFTKAIFYCNKDNYPKISRIKKNKDKNQVE